MIDHAHARLLHAPCQALLSSLRKRYWPLSGKSLILRIIILLNASDKGLALLSILWATCHPRGFNRHFHSTLIN